MAKRVRYSVVDEKEILKLFEKPGFLETLKKAAEKAIRQKKSEKRRKEDRKRR